MSAPAPVRVALLGTAHVHARDHARRVAADPRAGLAGVLPSAGAPLPCPDPADPTVRVRRAGSAEEALSGADAAIIASRTDEHTALLPAALGAGVPVLCEKPLAADAAGAEALHAAAAAAEARVSMAMFLRSAPVMRRVRALLAAGAIGAPTAVRAYFAHPGLLDGVFSGGAAWMLTERHGGGSGFADLALHLVDLLLWLDPRRKQGVRSARMAHRGGADTDSGGVALLDWGGVPALLRADWTSRPGGLGLSIRGEKGALRVRGGVLRVDAPGGADVEHHRAPAAEDASAHFIGSLADPAAGPGGGAATTADAVVCARVLDAVRRAAEVPGAPGAPLRRGRPRSRRPPSHR
ncbi:Gfo/Idh/MocA family protein [Nocardiopsis suaedae]|uniref:Gfo/Idh/MocA family oxidoreductase n=1 Tax=Nocardiopsis suaedae TaxID=3018444 RepID=A0ABT4TT69_9ACTN|nr:Gfo/Idh/MocA family oxidoreductase [Nocardiopsis suaedae]MDA2807636.1 Gfo/Idh/MocA family oxidoreductase [Nocardiopsis suaedae]